MAEDVATLSAELAQFSPFFTLTGGERTAAEPIDSVAVDVANAAELASIEGALDELLVEDVLESFFNRLKSCLELREKAHAIQALEVQNASMLKALQEQNGPAHEIAYLEMLGRFGEIDGHGLHFKQRFNYLRELFLENLKQAVARAKVAAKGLEKVYGIDQPTLPVATANGYLDALTLWGQRVSDKLHEELQSRRLYTMVFAMGALDAANTPSQIFSLTDWPLKRDARDFTFTLPGDYLRSRTGDDPLIRQVFFEAILDNPQRWWPANLAITNGAETKSAPVMLSAGGSERASQYALNAHFHNVSPFGDWQFTLEPKPNTAETGVTISNIMLHLTVSARRS